MFPVVSENDEPTPQEQALFVLRCLWSFSLEVVHRFFFEKKGLLLAGAVAYNTLLSLIPLCFVVLVAASVFMPEEKLLAIVQAELHMLAPAQADKLTEVIRAFFNERRVIGWVGAAVLLFLSSIAFRILEDAIAVVFHRPAASEKRKFWISFLIPYAYMVVLGTAVLALTVVTSLLKMIAGDSSVVEWILYLAGFVSLVALFTSIYKVLPVGKISTRRALAGGLTAAILWEITRRVLTWYFSDISLINVVYGSLATVIVVLVTLEVGAVIVLLGAEVIAALEAHEEMGLPWYGKVAGSED